MERKATTRDEHKAVGLIIAAIVTITVCLTTLERWYKLDSMGKSLAMLLIISLVITPVSVIRRENRGQPGNAYIVMFTEYMLVMIAIMAFTHTIR